MNLWRRYGLPLSEVSSAAKVYFSKRFLGGARISSAEIATLDEGFLRLNHAVNDGCHGRCLRLVEELNQALVNVGLETITDIESFLYWLTYDNTVVQDEYGEDVLEPGFSFPIRVFHDKENRKDFWREIHYLLKEGKMMSMQSVGKVVLFKRKNCVSLKKGS